MEQRLANTWKMTVNEKKFIETALLSDLRVDGRRPFDYRRLTIKFGKDDGSSEVQLGQTHVMGFVSSQMVQPYRERPNEGTLSIYTEFSPMADPSFEAGRPGESAIELGRIIDRGLRESRAVDTESLCVLAGKLVWAIRVDLHILDNGGNLVDAANVAALAALMTFRRPECTLGGEDGQEVVIHPPEENDPLPLIIHHLPIAVTFAFLGDGNIVVIDPSHNEEAVMGGRMTATLNTNGDICAVQKAGGDGVLQSVIMQCLRIASVKAADITTKIKEAVEVYSTERAQRKIKRHSSVVPMDINVPDTKMKQQNTTFLKAVDDLSKHHMEAMDEPEGTSNSKSNGIEGERKSTKKGSKSRSDYAKKFGGDPSSWDPYTSGIDSDFVKTSISSPERNREDVQKLLKDQNPLKVQAKEPALNIAMASSPPNDAEGRRHQMSGAKTLKDAVKPKSKRKKKPLADST
ncbi:Exosome complex component rrp42 [Thalictrum thalictroides]|uniref:Protein ECERIFERUM 7 n=1 Tax=Thalictrum thalictroides TaxID=46969 RepID=A0A7J6V2S8_THATH|nr:Exosome complex component rrp42 [Thalictrum thalictroides]